MLFCIIRFIECTSLSFFSTLHIHFVVHSVIESQKMMLQLILFILVSYSYQTTYSDETLNVLTRHGNVRGHQIETKDPRTGDKLSYARFPTIPYAKPPVGDLRFAGKNCFGDVKLFIPFQICSNPATGAWRGN